MRGSQNIVKMVGDMVTFFWHRKCTNRLVLG